MFVNIWLVLYTWLQHTDTDVPHEFMASIDDFEGVDDAEELNSVDVKMDLANTFIEMGDSEGAREILNEIISEADEEGQAKARALLSSIDQH